MSPLVDDSAIRAPSQGRQLPSWASGLIYVALTVFMTWPLALHLNTHLGAWDTDVMNVYWGNWWVQRALATGQNLYFTKDLIFPVGFNLVTFAFSPFIAALWISLSWLMSPAAAYNLVMIATILISAVAMDQLVRYLTGNSWAALLSGITFAFAPALVAERGAHLNLSLVAWLPLLALFLTRLLREARMRDVFFLALVVVLAFLTRLHVGALVLLFGGVYFLGLALVEGKTWPRLAWGRLALAGLIAITLLLPLVFLVVRALQQPEGEALLRGGAETNQTDVLAYLLPPPTNPLLGRWTRDIYQTRFGINDLYWAFVGFVPLLLALYAAIKRPRQVLPWLVTGLFFMVLALGPVLRLNGVVYSQVRLPYSLAPGFFATIGFDVPNRFNLALMAAVSVMAGTGAAALSSRVNRNWPILVLTVLILVEFVMVPMRLYQVPLATTWYKQTASDGQEYAMVDLPLTREAGETHRYFQTIHGKSIVGGWDHRVPPSAFSFMNANPLLAAWLGNYQPVDTLDQALFSLANANVRYIVIHKDQLFRVPDGMQSLFLAMKPLYEDDAVYVLPTDATLPESFGVVQQFDGGLGLARPSIMLSAPTERGNSVLAVETCWTAERSDVGADRIRLQMTSPDASLAYTGEKPLALPAAGTACQYWPVEVVPPAGSGTYTVTITPLQGEQALGNHTTAVPISVLQSSTRQPYPIIGTNTRATFDAPMELLGYNIKGGVGFVWTDLYWRSLADEERAYDISVDLVDVASGQTVVSDTEFVPKLQWKDGEIYHERRISWLEDVPQGQYEVNIRLFPTMDSTSIAAFDGATGEPLPGNKVPLETSVLVLPRALADSPASTAGRVLAYTSVLGPTAEPQHPLSAALAGVAELKGYSVQPKDITDGEELQITLYWKAINPQLLPVDYKVFVHLLDLSGAMVAQHDGNPAAERRSTRTWQAGDLILDTHQLQWQAGTLPASPIVEIGMYDPQTLQRVPAYDANGDRLPNDAVRLEVLTP